MKKILHQLGKFYSKVIMNLIGIFIFVGISSVLFGESGWMPHQDIYAISNFVYIYVIPVLFAYICGGQIGEALEEEKYEKIDVGGALAIMALASILVVKPQVGYLGSMLLGPACGLLWKKVMAPLLARWNLRIDMLVRNLVVAGMGICLSFLSLFFVAPFLTLLNQIFMQGISFLIIHKIIVLLSIVIEPAKVFFLNNSIHHGLLAPLGMQQTLEQGKSILFLLESNPGPGLGVLAALFLMQKKKRKEYAASIFVQCIGGIHEIYFPVILSNIWLLLAVIAGGMAGNFYFAFFNIGAVAAICPGSIITFLMVCAKTDIMGALLGVIISTVTSFLVAGLILYLQEKRKLVYTKKARVLEEAKEIKKTSELEEEKEIKKLKEQEEAEEIKKSKELEEVKRTAQVMEIRKIGFVCDAGVGSSAMGAALLRRKLKERDITGIEVSAYAVDQIPKDLSLIVCQENFKQLLLREDSVNNIYTMSSLLNQEELSALVELVKKNGK